MSITKKIKVYNVLKWLLLPWQILQTVIGCGVWIYSFFGRKHCIRKKSEDGIIYYETDPQSPVYGVSLGLFVFLSQRYQDSETIHHEFGHQIQSLILGVLYLFIIGIPSGLSNVRFFCRLFWGKEFLTDYDYYHENWWERQADKIGNVKHIVDEIKEDIKRIFII